MNTGVKRKIPALAPGERVANRGVVISRGETGEAVSSVETRDPASRASQFLQRVLSLGGTAHSNKAHRFRDTPSDTEQAE